MVIHCKMFNDQEKHKQKLYAAFNVAIYRYAVLNMRDLTIY
jgi:hypothetical protein